MQGVGRVNYKKLMSAYDTAVAELVRSNLKAHQLDIPGTVYFDENLYHLSDFYNAKPDKRKYFVLVDETMELPLLSDPELEVLG